jgi:hypothetical protein
MTQTGKKRQKFCPLRVVKHFDKTRIYGYFSDSSLYKGFSQVGGYRLRDAKNQKYNPLKFAIFIFRLRDLFD